MRGDFASDADRTEAVGTIGKDVEINERFIDGDGGGDGLSYE